MVFFEGFSIVFFFLVFFFSFFSEVFHDFGTVFKLGFPRFCLQLDNLVLQTSGWSAFGPTWRPSSGIDEFFPCHILGKTKHPS